MARTPAARGFTIAEKRSLRFEQISLYMVFLVALIAATISFIALKSVGADAGLGSASFLLPIAIDGFGIACSVGIIRSVAQGEALTRRLSEWIGLLASLGLSILGNVYHALRVGAADLPDGVKIAYATAVPLIVAYGIHVYGRAMSKGVSAHVLASDPDRVHFGLAHLGEETVAQTHAPVRTVARAPKQPAARKARASASTTTRVDDAAEPRVATPQAAPAARPRRGSDAEEELFDQYRTRLADGDRMDGNEISEALGIHPGAARNKRRKWDERIEAEQAIAAPTRDPILEQVQGEEVKEKVDESA